MTHQPAAHPVRILHLEDAAMAHKLVKIALDRDGLNFDIERVETLADFEQRLDACEFDLVLADYFLSGFTAMDAWALVKQRTAPLPFIIFSGAIGQDAAVDAIRQGISDYLLKDNILKLPHVIRRAIEVRNEHLARIQSDHELAASERRLAELTSHLQASIEQERATIAREIHDDIGGALVAINLDLAWCRRNSADPAVQEHAKAAMEMLQHALGASQRIMLNLRPAILDQGLAAGVQWLAADFEKRTGVRTFLRINDQGMTLPADIKLAAYRTAQEALTNVTKHAACSEVRIDLSDEEGMLTLEITDNGPGLSGEGLDKPKSFGLKGLRERARAVGGWLDVSAGGAGAGTSITLSIPLAAGFASGPQGDTA